MCSKKKIENIAGRNKRQRERWLLQNYRKRSNQTGTNVGVEKFQKNRNRWKEIFVGNVGPKSFSNWAIKLDLLIVKTNENTNAKHM